MLLERDQWRFSLAGDIHSGRIDSEIMLKNKQTDSFGVSSPYRQGFWVPSICESNQAHTAADFIMRIRLFSNQHNLSVYTENNDPFS